MNAKSKLPREIFNEAVEIADAKERAQYLASACGGDGALRQRVEALLEAHFAAGGFMGQAEASTTDAASALEGDPVAFEKPREKVQRENQRAQILLNNPAPKTHQPGDHIGRYKLLQQIGEGGCGVVFMAEQEEPIRRKVALKVIKLGMDTKAVIARFEAERQALALMDHPNIAKVLDAGATETGRPYFVMELVRGVRITDYCDQHNLTTRARLDLFMQVCHAIQHAHQKGIIHRDIKPSNILVTLHDGVPVPKVIDFGIAKATSDQRLTDKTLFTAFEQFMGTPAYMSPEQAEMSGLDIDTRTDIYSLGVLLYELLTGKMPFDGKELLAAGLDAMRRTIREKEPAKPSTRLNTMLETDRTEIAKHRQTEPNKLTTLLRGDLDWVVMKALEKDRTRRYDSANGLAADISRHLHNEPVVACPPTALYRLRKMARRNRLALAGVAAIAIALLLGTTISVWQAERATRAERNERLLRSNAEAANETALRALGRAENASRNLEATLSASDFLQGVHLIDRGQMNSAVAFLVRSLSNNPTNDAALTRLANLLTSCSWAFPKLRLDHDARVISAQFSPNGKRIVTSSMDHSARIWDAQTGQLLTEPLRHNREVNSVQFSPDGKRIVTASGDQTARVWDAQTGRPVTGSIKHDGRVLSAQFSPDGRRVVTASDYTVRVWDAETGQPLTEPWKVAPIPHSLQFSRDGKRIVTASANAACVWEAETGQFVARAMATNQWIYSVEFSPDGKRILTASASNTARVWDAETGQPLTEPMAHGQKVYSARFSADGTRIVTASEDNTARVWNAENGKPWPLTDPMRHGSRVTSAQFSPDGKNILTVSDDTTARVWDSRTGRPLTEPIKHAQPVHSAAFHTDGKRILTVSEDATALVWDTDTSRSLAKRMYHLESVCSAEFSTDGNRIVTASADGTARVWDAQDGRALTDAMSHPASVKAAHFSPDATRVVTASADRVRVWNADTGEELVKLRLPSSPVMTVEFSPDGKYVATASMSDVRVWDARDGKALIEPIRAPRGVISAQFSPDAKRILTVYHDGIACVWNVQSGQSPAVSVELGPFVHSAQFSSDGLKIVTVGDETISVWDAQTGQRLAETRGVRDRGLSAKFSPDGKRIVTTAAETFRVWDAATGLPLTEIMKHEDSILSVHFSPDGRRIVTGSKDNTARVWDSRTGQLLAEPMKHDSSVRSAQFSPDGKRVVTASSYAASLWDIAPTPRKCPEWLLHLAEAVAGQAASQQGVLEQTKLKRVEVLNQIRQRLNQEPGNDDWVVWGRWFLADPATRTISPFSKIKVPSGGDQ